MPSAYHGGTNSSAHRVPRRDMLRQSVLLPLDMGRRPLGRRPRSTEGAVCFGSDELRSGRNYPRAENVKPRRAVSIANVGANVVRRNALVRRHAVCRTGSVVTFGGASPIASASLACHAPIAATCSGHRVAR